MGPEYIQQVARWSAAGVELVGIVIIVVLALSALVHGLRQLLRRAEGRVVFEETRRRLVRGVLMGLEFLVAADIIHTVAVDLSFTTVGVLAVVVLIRTFLSFTLELEMTGRWPWQPREG